MEKKQISKNISNLNNVGKNTENKKENPGEYNCTNIIKLEDTEIKLNKEKHTKRRNMSSNIFKEKGAISIDKNRFSIENQTRKNFNLFKEPVSCKNATKIEINSHDKLYNFEQNKKEDNKNNTIQNKINDEKINIKTITNNANNSNNKKTTIKINCNTSGNINTENDIQKFIIDDSNNKIKNEISSPPNKTEESNKEKEKEEKEKLLIHKCIKNKKPSLLSNKSVQSDDLDNDGISNINGNSNTLNTTNEANYSLYSTNSNCNVNKFVLNDCILDINDRVIKELASELEQSTNKKEIMGSNKKKIEENFKVICNKIAPLNLNKANDKKSYTQKNLSSIKIINENDVYQNENSTLIGDNCKINTISTEKTEEIKTGNSNNICNININQNDYNSLSKKMDSFDKKLLDLESLLKEKIIEILLQIENLQNTCGYSLNNQRKSFNQKLNNINNAINFPDNLNINNINSQSDFLYNNFRRNNSRDDYFIHSHSVKRLAPIIEIDPINLQFSPSPIKTQNIILSNKKSKGQNKSKGLKTSFTNNFKDIRLFRKNENKENSRTVSNLDNWDITKFKIITKSGIGVNKWINLNKLIKYEQSKTANFSSNNIGLLSLGNYENNK
jgi:hypothetical protein